MVASWLPSTKQEASVHRDGRRRHPDPSSPRDTPGGVPSGAPGNDRAGHGCDSDVGLGESPPREPDHPRRTRARDILAPAFRRFLWDSYDHLGLLVLMNLLWLLFCLPVVTAPAATAALFQVAGKIVRREEVSVRDFFRGFRSLFLPGLKFGAFTALAAVVFWVAIDFYASLGGRATLPGMFIAGAFIWAAAFLLLMQVHAFPLIARGDQALLTILRKSALLILDNVGYSIGIAIQALAVAVLCIATGAGLVLIVGSLLAVLLTAGHHELLKRYFPPDPGSEAPPESRSWRQLFRPWDAPKSP